MFYHKEDLKSVNIFSGFVAHNWKKICPGEHQFYQIFGIYRGLLTQVLGPHEPKTALTDRQALNHFTVVQFRICSEHFDNSLYTFFILESVGLYHMIGLIL